MKTVKIIRKSSFNFKSNSRDRSMLKSDPTTSTVTTHPTVSFTCFKAQ